MPEAEDFKGGMDAAIATPSTHRKFAAYRIGGAAGAVVAGGAVSLGAGAGTATGAGAFRTGAATGAGAFMAGAATGAGAEADPPTVNSGRNFSTLFIPNPLTLSSSSTVLKGPFFSR